jgi:hypothetical protein
LNGLKNSGEWAFQHECFSLLEHLYKRSEKPFDKVLQAKALIDDNVYFFLDIAKGYYELSDWLSVIETAQISLPKIPFIESAATDWRADRSHQAIRAAIQAIAVDAYENLKDYTRAFEAAKLTFLEAPNFTLYKRARGLAEKVSCVSSLLTLAENVKQNISSYTQSKLLLNIYSYEGEVEKMLEIALAKEIDQNYYDCKYIARSLIFRALHNATEIGASISEYLTSALGQDGIVDMIDFDRDKTRQTELLLSGADLLKGMIKFHIGAANRSRYAKAAYYTCILRDIYVYLNQEGSFRGYFGAVIAENSRRPALRDEMSVVYGKEATIVKKRSLE